MNKKYFILLAGILAAHLLLLAVLKFTAWPEMLLWPYLIVKGWLPYTDIAIAHTPLMLVKLAFFYKIFGVGIIQLKAFTWALILILDFLVYWISRKLWNEKVALVAVAFFVFWQVFFEGNGLWFDLFMGIPIFVSYYFVKSKNFVWAGIFWALAFISKQTAFWFLIPIGLEFLLSKKYLVERAKGFVLGTLVIVIPAILILWFFGTLRDFYRWAIDFGIFILPRAQGQVQLPDLKNLAISLFPFAVFLPLFFMKKKGSFNLFLWAVVGAMGAYPRFEYFHFQPAIPYLAIASALVFTSEWHKKDLVKAFIPVYVLGSLYLFGGFFMRNYKEGVRFYESDVQDVVSYIKSNTSAGDRIFVLNYWDNVYALSGTLPAARPWVPQLSWYMDAPGIQEKMVSDLTSSKPKLIIENPYEPIGLGAYKPFLITDYVSKNYKLKERVDNLDILIQK